MRTQSILVVVLGSWGVTLASGCSGSTSGERDSNPVPQDQFVTAFVSAVCDNIGPCCAEAGYAYDATKCKATASAQYDSLFGQTENVVYDPAKAGSCIEAVKQAAASCGELDLDGSKACQNIYKGLLPEGAECNSSAQCATPVGGDATCDQEGGGAGHCVVDKRGVEGDACYATCTEEGSGTGCGSSGGDPTTASCYTNDGVFCNAAYVCAKLAMIGEACEGDGCVTGAYCNAGTCAALPVTGEPCGSGYHCAQGTHCGGDSTCTADKAAGEACGDFDQCADGYCSEGACKKSSLASPGVCSGESNP